LHSQELGLSNEDLALQISRMIREGIRGSRQSQKQVSIVHTPDMKDAQWLFYNKDGFVAKQTEEQIQTFLKEELEYLSHCDEVN